MGQFRDRMDDELRFRGYSASTRECYVHCVRHFMRPPDQLTLEHIRQYQLYLTRDRHVAWTYFNQVVCALRFFYREGLKKDWEVRHIPYQKTGRKLPEILSPQEVAALFQATGRPGRIKGSSRSSLPWFHSLLPCPPPGGLGADPGGMRLC